MKKFIAVMVSMFLCLGMITPILAATSNQWYEISDEELREQGLLPSEEEENAITEAERGKKAITDEEYAAFYAPERIDIDCITDINIAEKNFNESTLEIPEFIQINEKLNIDCKNGDIKELTEYLEANVKGFSSDSFKVELINNTNDVKDSYAVFYGLQINGFETPYKVSVFIENDDIKYYVSFDESDYEKLISMPMTFTENMLWVKTVFVDDTGCRFALLYEYKLVDINSDSI